MIIAKILWEFGGLCCKNAKCYIRISCGYLTLNSEVLLKNRKIFTKESFHVRSGNDNNGSFCWRNMREHEVGPGNGSDGELWIGSRLLRRDGADDPQAAYHHCRPHAQVQVATGELRVFHYDQSQIFHFP